MDELSMKACQSCGMPMRKEGDFGTEADGALSKDYCTHCYRNGAFTDPGITIDEMAEKGGAILAQLFEIPVENAKNFCREQTHLPEAVGRAGGCILRELRHAPCTG